MEGSQWGGIRRRKRENVFEAVEHELEEDAEMVADKTGMETWMVFALFAVILLVVVGLLVYCFWRFFAKRRGKKDGDCQKEIDEQAILDGEEEMDVNEDDPLKVS